MVGMWGIAHAIPTPQVIAGFEPTSRDNHRVILQEWLVEAFAMWGIAALAIGVTFIDSGASTSAWVYRIAAALLVALAGLTALTGSRTRVVWFKVCPVLLTSSAALLVVASIFH